MLNKFLLLTVALLIALNSSAQDGMEEYFYQSGKIKVVVAVVSIVLAGLLYYIFSLERRLKKLENKK
jgi:uncharacterized protein HemY